MRRFELGGALGDRAHWVTVHGNDLSVEPNRVVSIVPLLRHVVPLSPSAFVLCIVAKMQDGDCVQSFGKVQETAVLEPELFRTLAFHNKGLDQGDLITTVDELQKVAVHSVDVKN